MKSLPTLYSRTHTGAIQQWTIFVEGGSYRTEYGQVNGKLITTEWTHCEATNVGRSNERDEEAQALFQATALWNKRKEISYFENINDIDNEQFNEPMRAQDYHKRRDELKLPVFSQPKLDGIRCTVSLKGMISRNNKPFVSTPHIYEALLPYLEADPSLIFDGELYCDKLADNFDEICSIVKKQKPTQEDIDKARKVLQYWIYDIADTKSKFSDRFNRLNNLFNDYGVPYCIKIVETNKVTSFDEIDKLYELYVEDGKEGQMIRTDTVYEYKRTKALLKRKEFITEEYKILSIGEGNGNKAGMAGYAFMENKDGTPFRTNIKGNRAFLKRLLREKDTVEGKPGTVKFFNLTPKGVPRFPYLIAVRDYE